MTIAMITDCLGIIILQVGVLSFCNSLSAWLLFASLGNSASGEAFGFSARIFTEAKNNFINNQGFILQKVNSSFFISEKNNQPELQRCATTKKIVAIASLQKIKTAL
jgi:hypothetical protein